MGHGIYSAVSGAKTQSRYLDIIANNLANVSTSGYKADELSFGDFLVRSKRFDMNSTYLEKEFPPPSTNLKPRSHLLVKITGQRVDLGQGRLKPTGNALDLALDGPGFFEVSLNDKSYYTRNGQVSIDAEGQLVHSSGALMLDENGAPLTIDGSYASLVIDQEGHVLKNGSEAGRLKVVEVPLPQSMVKTGHTLFTYTDAQTNPPLAATRTAVKQGFMEMSNVNPIREMTKMIQVNRHFEALNKVIKAYREVDRRSIEEVGGSR